MALLRTLHGPAGDQQIEIDRDQILLGRGADCDVVLSSPSLSRHHAQILRINNEFFLRDLNSRNGIFVNGQQVRSDVPLRLQNNDRIQLGGIHFVFQDHSVPTRGGEAQCNILATCPLKRPGMDDTAGMSISESDQVWDQPMAATETRSLTSKSTSGWSVSAECWRLREALTTNHVRAEYPPEIYAKLLQHLTDPTARNRHILAKGFYRLILLDAADSLDASGQFDLAVFLRRAVKQLVQAFNLDLPQGTYGPEDIAQILKDERRSLFCFLNAQSIPEPLLTRLRNFTQEMHQALMLFEKQPILEEDRLLPEILDGLFQTFPQADRGFLLLCAEEAASGATAMEKLLTRVIKTRQPHEESFARFSRVSVRHCLQNGQALLVEEGMTDTRFDLSQTIGICSSRSVMCAPLRAGNGQMLGVIQLDTLLDQKPFTPDDLQKLAHASNQAAQALETARTHHVQLARARQERELHLAQEAQRRLLSADLPVVPGYDFFAHAESVGGGDCYGFISLPQQRLAVFVGDVSGHGTRASTLATRLTENIQPCLLSTAEPAAAVARLNDLFLQAGAQDMFATLVLTVLDVRRHLLTVVNAGHTFPLLRRSPTGEIAVVGDQDLIGMPLGIVEGSAYQACAVELAPDDCVILWTDGVSEGRVKEDGSFFDLGFLKAVVQAGPALAPALGRHLLRTLDLLASGPLRDDLTLVCFSRRA